MNHLPSTTLSAYYHQDLLAEAAEELRPRTLREIRTALRHWQKLTGDPPVRLVGPDHVRSLRDGMLRAGLAPATIAKTWSHLLPLLRAARQDGLITEMPQVGRLRRSILPKSIRHQRRDQRRPVTGDELQRLWRGCAAATYPVRADRTELWRMVLYLAWTYGIRTGDLFRLRVSDFDFAAKVIRFRASKTCKLQGLPLTDLGCRLVTSVCGHKAASLLPGFRKPGGWNRPRNGSDPCWIPGYYATWNREICASVGIMPGTGPVGWLGDLSSRPDSVPPIRLKTLRQTMVTQLNDLSSGGRQLGGWMAGHYQPGVTAQNYDQPDLAIREAVERRERELLPGCFRGLVG